MTSAPIGRSGLWDLLLLGTLGGLLFPFAQVLAGLQDGDGLLTAIISTQKLTWYFWGQDRLLNLFPAIASPFHDMELNLRVQLFLRSFMTMLAPMALFVLLESDIRRMAVLTALTGVVLALGASNLSLFNLYVQHNSFSTALALFAFSTIGWRYGCVVGYGAALVLGCLAYTANVSLIMATVPMIMVCLVCQPADRRWLARLLGLQVVLFLLAVLHAKLVTSPVTSFGLSPSWDVIKQGWAAFSSQMNIWFYAGLLVLSVAAAMLAGERRKAVAPLLIALGVPLSVPAQSCLTWVQMNIYDIRYFLMFAILFCAACTYLLASTLSGLVSRRPARLAIYPAGVVLVFLGCLGGLTAQPEALMQESRRATSAEAAQIILTQDVSLISGDFWDVWPAIFASREALRQSGRDENVIFGAAFRGHVMAPEVNAEGEKKGALRVLCLFERTSDCIRQINQFLWWGRPFSQIGDDQPIDVGGKAALLFTVRQTPFEALHCFVAEEMDKQVYTQQGVFRGGALSNQGEPGFLMFGPYRPLGKGDYRLIVRGTANATKAWIDVSSDSRGRQYFHTPIVRSADGILIDAPVRIDDDLTDLEVRVWTDGGDAVTIDSYSLTTSEDGSCGPGA